ncbi:anther-specific protein LAT52-like [Impatiens glandulifera]|uniref:anther-specific protein LAT52-like n=1 Tax=Impatiens glandulifera TaxID=253017 RepID=UPI001FB086EC|nr:anther-specific protein LAT52-like [Impatiens glandulifera]
MANYAATLFLASALFFLAMASSAHGHGGRKIQPEFQVNGKVYCDPCRLQFLTRVSRPLIGAVVKLSCRNRVNGTLTFQVMGKTDFNGMYNLKVNGEHEKDICEVVPVRSPDPHCRSVMDHVGKARVSLTLNSGISSSVRYVSPIGYMNFKAITQCPLVFSELGFVPRIF